MLGALEYLEWLGKTFGGEQAEGLRDDGYRGRRMELKKAMTALRACDFELSRALLATLTEIPGLRLYGLADPRKLDQRVPTFSFTLEGRHPRLSLRSWLPKASMFGTGTTTPWPSPSGWGLKPAAGWCASAQSTTIHSTK